MCVNIPHNKLTCPILRWRYIVVILSTYYRPPASDVFLWIYRPMHRTDYLFIINSADLKKMVNDAVLEYICLY